MATTKIEWTAGDDGTPGKTWNPIRGCSIVSPGCVNCYAMKQAHRFSGEGRAYHGLTKQTKAGPQWTGKVVCDEEKLLEPLSWRTPSRVFVNSMSDLFHEDVHISFVAAVFGVMASAPRHTFQVLTKRPARMEEFFRGWPTPLDCVEAARRYGVEVGWPVVEGGRLLDRDRWPLPNVWLGVSAEDQPRLDERLIHLCETPAAVRFVSAEPLLGPLDFRGMWKPQGIDWVIVGGESGPGARPCDLAWVRSIVQQCKDANVACFVKQLGAWPMLDWPAGAPFPPLQLTRGSTNGRRKVSPFLNLENAKGGDISEFPVDLRVREYPLGGRLDVMPKRKNRQGPHR